MSTPTTREQAESTPPSTTNPAAAIVLAAGAGTRMKSVTPKILHTLGGKSMLAHALAAVDGLHPQHTAVVVRHERDRVAEHITEIAPNALIVDQDETPGTGRAVEVAVDALGDIEGTVVVTYADVPLLTTQLLSEFVAAHESGNQGITILTAVLDDPGAYGRILRDADGSVRGIVEYKDANDDERAVREINSGIYAFDAALLRRLLPQLSTDNAQHEKYLTDTVGLARAAGTSVAALSSTDHWQLQGANDRVELAQLGVELNRRTVERWMRAGVAVVDPATTWIDGDVVLEPDSTLLPGTQLHGRTSIASGATVGPESTLTDVEVGPNATVIRTHGSGARIGANATVGPFAYLRPGTVLGEKGKIGTFVETKNADIGPGSKVPHLSYVGDATIGEGSNIGAASVFVNYDGVNKHHTTIGSHVRMGSDNMYIAPVTVGDGAYSGAGTVVRKDVPPGALAINVAPQRNMDGWVQNKRPGTAAAEAAEKATKNTQNTNDDDASTSAESDPA